MSAKLFKGKSYITISENKMQPADSAPETFEVLAPKCTYAIQREKTWLDGRTYFEYVPEPARFKALKILPQEIIEARKEKHAKQLAQKDAKKCGFNSIKEQNECYYRNIRKDTKLKKCVLNRPKHGWGRVIGDDSLTFRAMERFSRNTIITDHYADFDIENAQAMVTCCAAMDEGDKCDQLQTFCKSRKNIIEKGMETYGKSRDEIKQVWTSLLNGGAIPDWYEDHLARRVQKEVWTIRQKIKQANPELFESMRQKVTKQPDKYKDEDGLQKAAMRSMMSVWFQHYEVKIVATILEWCEGQGLLNLEGEGDAYKDKAIFGYIYDGFVLLISSVEKWGKRTGQCVAELLEKFNQITYEKTGFELNWTMKPFNNIYDIQDKMISIMAAPPTLESKRLTGDMSFSAMSEEFEKTHCKIQDVGCYIEKKSSGLVIVRNAGKLKESFGHLWCGYNEKGAKINFIDAWTKNNDEIRIFERMNIYPNTAMCPPTEYNLWIPFAMERVEEFTWRQDVLDMFVDFLKLTICGHQPHHTRTEQFDYMMDWLAHLVQRPEQKCGKCPILISKQGSGKGTLTRIMKRILGDKKVFQSVKPERDVWGDFNPMMEDAMLVILDECDKKKAGDAENTLKNYITEGTMTINNKYVPPHDIISNHRFMVHTNASDGGVQMADGDRRFFALRMSDHRKGDLAYWGKWNRLLDDMADDSPWKTIYDHLMARDVGDFMQKTTPKTEFQLNLEKSNKEPLDCWMEDMVTYWRVNKTPVQREMTGEEVWFDYTKFCERNGFTKKGDSSSNGLSARLNNHEISRWGGESGKGWKATETKRGGANNYRVFRLNEMWNYYVEKGIFKDEDFDHVEEEGSSDEDSQLALPEPAAAVLVSKKRM